MNQSPEQSQSEKMQEKILLIRRVSKKTTGGNYVTFSALVAVGDGKGKVGLGIGRGLEVPPAIQKAITQAKKKMVEVPIYKESIPHQIMLKFKAAKILLKPAPIGTGLKVGGVTRVILDLAGVYNASGKVIGSRNQVVNAYAVIEAIKKLKSRGPAKTQEVAAEPQEQPKKEEAKVEKKAAVAEPKAEKTTVEKKEVKKAAEKKTVKKPAKK